MEVFQDPSWMISYVEVVTVWREDEVQKMQIFVEGRMRCRQFMNYSSE